MSILRSSCIIVFIYSLAMWRIDVSLLRLHWEERKRRFDCSGFLAGESFCIWSKGFSIMVYKWIETDYLATLFWFWASDKLCGDGFGLNFPAVLRGGKADPIFFALAHVQGLYDHLNKALRWRRNKLDILRLSLPLSMRGRPSGQKERPRDHWKSN